jgi:hypothetical protein
MSIETTPTLGRSLLRSLLSLERWISFECGVNSYIEYPSRADADEAIKSLHKTELKGVTVSIEEMVSRRLLQSIPTSKLNDFFPFQSSLPEVLQHQVVEEVVEVTVDLTIDEMTDEMIEEEMIDETMTDDLRTESETRETQETVEETIEIEEEGVIEKERDDEVDLDLEVDHLEDVQLVPLLDPLVERSVLQLPLWPRRKTMPGKQNDAVVLFVRVDLSRFLKMLFVPCLLS